MEQQEFVLYETLYQQNESPFGAENASTTQRFVNYLIDTIIFYVVMYGMVAILLILFYIKKGRPDNSGLFQLWLFLSSYILYVLFYTFSEGASRGRSVGKLVTRTKVVREDESEITWKDAFIRSLCRVVPFEALSAFGGYPWHDKWSNTKVIRIN